MGPPPIDSRPRNPGRGRARRDAPGGFGYCEQIITFSDLILKTAEARGDFRDAGREIALWRL